MEPPSARRSCRGKRGEDCVGSCFRLGRVQQRRLWKRDRSRSPLTILAKLGRASKLFDVVKKLTRGTPGVSRAPRPTARVWEPACFDLPQPILKHLIETERF
jgi:hypothetical protein